MRAAQASAQPPSLDQGPGPNSLPKIFSVQSNLRRDRARKLRFNQTPAEIRLWDKLRDRRLEG